MDVDLQEVDLSRLAAKEQGLALKEARDVSVCSFWQGS